MPPSQRPSQVSTSGQWGDSRVEGFRPVYESYRYELWKRLIDENIAADFIGQNRDIGSYPRYRGQPFDRDHDGYGGATSQDILEGVAEVLSELATPDILLLGIGGNDLVDAGASVERALVNIRGIIAVARQRNPQITVLVEQIAPTRSDILTQALRFQIEALNQGISGLARQLTNSSSKVVSVDMYTGWSDAFMADEVHYNVLGAQEVAQRYFQELQNLFEEVTTPEPNPAPTNAKLIPLATIIVLLLD